MALLAQYSVCATPGRRIVEVYDTDACLGDEAAMDAAESQVVAGNGYHLYLMSLQPDITVQVAIRIWGTPPAPPADAEGHTPITLESETGVLVVNQLERGPAGEMPLPRPGVYEGHAWWAGRQGAADYYDTFLAQDTEDWSTDKIRQYFEQCPADERYVLDLAYTREPEPEPDEDEDQDEEF
ncbi:hypothetical protein [Streptomyces siamensis]|uniref:Uncharacterized protein n=1 Tax=Streptomyces siamensis TaxID=1274986 RepID=A0ABP9JI01_9ACTN